MNGFQPIGNLMPAASKMRCSPDGTSEATNSDPAGKPSATITPAYPIPIATLEALTGALAFGDGSAINAIVPPAYWLPVEEPPVERALRIMRQSGLTPPDGWRSAWPECRTKSPRLALRVEAMLSHYIRQNTDPQVSEIVLTDWCEALAGLPYYAVELACKAWLRGARSHLKPSVGDIRRTAELYGTEFRKAAS